MGFYLVGGGSGGGRKILRSETFYIKWNFDIKKSMWVHFRGNLPGIYSKDPIFCSCSALFENIIPFLRGKSNQGENSHRLPWARFPALQPGKLCWFQPGLSFQHWELLGKGCWRRALKRVAGHELLAGNPWCGPGGQAACGTWATKYPQPLIPSGWRCSWKRGPLGAALLGACYGSVWIACFIQNLLLQGQNENVRCCRIFLSCSPMHEWTQRNICSNGEWKSKERKKL